MCADSLYLCFAEITDKSETPVFVGVRDVGLVSVGSLLPWVVSSNFASISPKDNGESSVFLL